MENFFYEDTFCRDIQNLLYHLNIESEDIAGLPDDWKVDCGKTNLEKIGTVSRNFITKHLAEIIQDRFDERMSDDPPAILQEIESAIEKSFDIDKLNDLMPSLYYLNGEDFTITKQDLLACFLPNPTAPIERDTE